MAVPPIIPFNDMPPLDEFHLSSGYPGFALIEKSAQAFDKAASDCMVSSYIHYNNARLACPEYARL